MAGVDQRTIDKTAAVNREREKIRMARLNAGEV
jgi:hypothetical protein